MNLIRLRAFVAIAQLGSFTAAARQLHVSQPTLSAHIKALEHEHGVLLFERRHHDLRLSPTGSALLAVSRPLFELADQAEALLAGTTNLLRGRLAIAADAPAHVISAMARLRQHHPQLELALAAGNSQQVLARVLRFDSDVAVLADVEPHPRLHIQHILRDDVVLIVSREHRWSRRKTLRLPEIATEPLVMREPGSITRAILLRALHAEHIAPGPMIEIGSREAVREAVAAGLGAGAVFASEVGHDRRLHSVRVRHPAMVGDEYLVCLRDRLHEAAIAAFIAAMAA